MVKALENIKVLDFTRVVGGPFCTLLMQNLGAEVIKVEIPGGGDTFRTFPPLTEGLEGYGFLILNRGKKSITLNLEAKRGREIAKELVKKVDVIVENFRPGVMERLGLSYEELRKINPPLIYASISGFGHSGPRSSQASFDIVAQAMGGLMSVTGFPDTPPTRTGPSIGDYMGGLNATIAILTALFYREKTGEGQTIDISLQDGIWSITGMEYIGTYALYGNVPLRYGNGHLRGTPYGTYPTKDGYAVIAIGTVGHWESFLKVIGRTDLIGVPKYATQSERHKYKDEVDTIVSEWTKERTAAEVLNELEKANLPCSPLPTFEEVLNDPHLLSRDMIIEVQQPISGNLRMPGSVFKLSKTPGNASSPAPFLGQHNYEVYSGILGYSEQEVRELENSGII